MQSESLVQLPAAALGAGAPLPSVAPEFSSWLTIGFRPGLSAPP